MRPVEIDFDAPEPDPVVITRPDPPPAPARPSSAPARELRHEMDELRAQLETAFDELMRRLGRLEAGLGTLADRPADGPPLDLAVLNEHLAQLTHATLDGLDELRGSVRTALAERHSSDASTSQIETSLALVAEAIQDLRSQPPHVAGDGPDAGAIEDRLDQLATAVEERLADGRTQIDQGLSGVRRVLRTMQERPAVVDMQAVEEAARRASLPNAADLANLRREVTTLTEAVRAQDKGIGELRETLDWIKERLLLR